LPPTTTAPAAPAATVLASPTAAALNSPTAASAAGIPVVSQIINAENAARLEKVVSLDLPSSFLMTTRFTSDGRYLITGDASGETLVWEPGAWQKRTFLAPQTAPKTSSHDSIPFYGALAISPNGQMIATTNAAGEVNGRDWDGKELFTLSLGSPVYSAAVSPDGRYLAVGCEKEKLIIFDLETRQQVAELTSDHEYISNLVFSPDGKTLLASYERPGNVMKTWDVSTWKETLTFSHAAERFDYHDILFSPDGQYLVLASTRIVLEFLDMETKQVVKELYGHTRAPYQIAFSPDGSLLASASDDMTVRIWDVETGQALKVIKNQYEAGTVAFSPDGALLVFGIWGEGLQVWAIATAP
jgi:WD40 repeat protein